MAEDAEAIPPDRGAEGLAAALAVRPRRSKPRAPAGHSAEDAFLAAETRKLELELHHLKLGHFDKLLTVGLKLLTVAVGVAFAAAVVVLAWEAHAEHGVVIEAFSVPPDLAQRGYTGQAVARALLDRLSAMQAATVTNRPADTYSNDWGRDIKIEIPETGISIGELKRFLHEEFSRDTRISGEVMRTGTGLAITARAGVAQGRTFSGSDSDFDKLVQRAAEAVYAQTQPYRYAVYLYSTGRRDEAIAAYARLAQTSNREERAWAYGAWSQALLDRFDARGAEAKAKEAMKADPGLWLSYSLLTQSARPLSHSQEIYVSDTTYLRLTRSGRIRVSAGALDELRRFQAAEVAMDIGDYQAAAATLDTLDSSTSEGSSPINYVALKAIGLASNHDFLGVRRLAQEHGLPHLNAVTDVAPLVAIMRAGDLEDPDLLPAAAQQRGNILASTARAYARAGRIGDAEAVVANTAPDCDDCLLARAEVAAAKGDWAQMDRWLTIVSGRTPSLPFADSLWSELLLNKGDPDAAIAKAASAHRKSPNYPDALEAWGEALLRKGAYAGAAEKLRQAHEHAPNWGRNHLRWGEALMLSGRYAEARRQYEIASTLDLSKRERAALQVLLARTSRGPLHG